MALIRFRPLPRSSRPQKRRHRQHLPRQYRILRSVKPCRRHRPILKPTTRSWTMRRPKLRRSKMPTLIANVAHHSRRRVATISLLACLTLCSCRAIEMSLPADTRVNNATASSATTTSTTSADDAPLTTAVAARPSPVESLVQTSAGFAPVVAAPQMATNAGLLIPNRGSDQLEPTTLTGATGPPEIAPASLLAPCPNCAPRSVWGQGLQQAGDPFLPATRDQQGPKDK